MSNAFQWFPPKPVVTKPAALSLDERKVAARQEALKCLQDPDADNTLLAQILRAKHNLDPTDAAQAVEEARAVIAEGNGEEQ
jgi:hypothetical protein